MFSTLVKQARWSFAAAALLLLPGTRLLAQQGAVEIGVDGEAAYHMTPGKQANFFDIMLPFGGFDVPRVHNAFRVGYFASDRVAIESSANLTLLHAQGQSSTRFGLAADVQYHFVTDPARPRPFLSVGANSTIVGRYSTFAQVGVSAEMGVKIPVHERLGIRLAGGVGRFFPNSDFIGRTTVFGTVGLSYFTR